MADMNDDQIIETMTEDGEVVQFRLFDIIKFEENNFPTIFKSDLNKEKDGKHHAFLASLPCTNV